VRGREPRGISRGIEPRCSKALNAAVSRFRTGAASLRRATLPAHRLDVAKRAAGSSAACSERAGPPPCSPAGAARDVGPDDWFGSGLGYILGLTGPTAAMRWPRSALSRSPIAMVTLLERQGGRLRSARRRHAHHLARSVAPPRRSCSKAAKRIPRFPRGAGRYFSAVPVPLICSSASSARFMPAKMRNLPPGFRHLKLDLALSCPCRERARSAA